MAVGPIGQNVSLQDWAYIIMIPYTKMIREVIRKISQGYKVLYRFPKRAKFD